MRNITLLIIFVLSMALIFIGQKNIGYFGLLLEVIGLAGLLTDLYIYNKKYK